MKKLLNDQNLRLIVTNQSNNKKKEFNRIKSHALKNRIYKILQSLNIRYKNTFKSNTIDNELKRKIMENILDSPVKISNYLISNISNSKYFPKGRNISILPKNSKVQQSFGGFTNSNHLNNSNLNGNGKSIDFFNVNFGFASTQTPKLTSRNALSRTKWIKSHNKFPLNNLEISQIVFENTSFLEEKENYNKLRNVI